MIESTNRYKWLFLIYNLPPKPTRSRVHIWRSLKGIGAVSLKKSVYIIPFNAGTYERYQWLCQEIQTMNGDATFVKVSSMENLKDEDVIKMFNMARDADYKKIIDKFSMFSKKIVTAGKQGIKNQLKLRNELKIMVNQLNSIQEIDFFKSPLYQKAQNVSNGCIKELAQLLSRISDSGDKNREVNVPLKKQDFQGEKWVTRKRPHIDRIATAWLIKRFIDLNARIVFVQEGNSKIQGIPFDMYHGEFSHQGDDCTFETMLRRFDIKDKALKHIAEIVHDIDLNDEKFVRNEAKGIDSIVRGLSQNYKNDHVLLEKGFELFDALYAILKK